jgi:hypothetical protein
VLRFERLKVQTGGDLVLVGPVFGLITLGDVRPDSPDKLIAHAAGPPRSSLALSQAVGTFKSLPIRSVLMSPDRAAA